MRKTLFKQLQWGDIVYIKNQEDCPSPDSFLDLEDIIFDSTAEIQFTPLWRPSSNMIKVMFEDGRTTTVPRKYLKNKISRANKIIAGSVIINGIKYKA